MSVWDKSRDKSNELFGVSLVLLGTGVGRGEGVKGNGCVGVCGGDLSMALSPFLGLGGGVGFTHNRLECTQPSRDGIDWCNLVYCFLWPTEILGGV